LYSGIRTESGDIIILKFDPQAGHEQKGIRPAKNGTLPIDGCRDPLVLWNGILIDGYNRYKICTENNIPFKTIDKEFASREEVLI
jgi:hypothetical protein